MPFTPLRVYFGFYPTLVLGENGTAFATDGFDTNSGPQIVSFNLNSGGVNWNYRAGTQSSLSLMASALGNALVAKITDQTGADTMIRFDSSGAATADIWSASHVQYFVGDWYLGFPASSNSAMAFLGAPVLRADSEWLTPEQGGTSEAEPDLKLLGQSDCESVSGRALEYWLVKPTGATADQPYVVFEKNTDHSVASPDGVSPLDYSGGKNKFNDALRPGAGGESHDSIQTFNFGLQGERLYHVRRIQRKLANANVSVLPPEFHIVIKPFAQAILNGQHAPYVGPCFPNYPPQ